MADELREAMKEMAKSGVERDKALKNMLEGQKEMQGAMKNLAEVVAGLGIFVNGLHDKAHTE